MKKTLSLLCALLTVVLLAACGGNGRSSGNTLFDKASPETSVLDFAFFDGESGQSGWISDLQEEKELLAALSAVDAEPDSAWTMDDIGYPMYGISICQSDGRFLHVLWTNGRLIAGDGKAYTFDYDFDALKDAYEWDSLSPVSAVVQLPNAWYLLQNGERWNTAYLSPSTAELNTPAGISMELTNWADGLVDVEFTNAGDRDWTYGEYFALEYESGGVWYSIPTTPEEWGFNDIGYILRPGETRAHSFNIGIYGALPQGNYRLVAQGMAVDMQGNSTAPREA